MFQSLCSCNNKSSKPFDQFYQNPFSPISNLFFFSLSISLSQNFIMRFSKLIGNTNPSTALAIPLIDLSDPDSKNLIVKACEEFGFFKVVNHGVPTQLIADLESEAVQFFSLPLSEKQKSGPPDPFGYGNKKIGQNGDVGWVEYLLMNSNSQFDSPMFQSQGIPESFRSSVREYVAAVRNMAGEVVELMADGLKIQPRNMFSKLLKDEQSDSFFRLNHYPPCPEAQALDGTNLIGFGEHTDPQIISVLRSNNTSGLEISLRDGNWMSVPPDEDSFFINVGDSLQVMTNGRFRSVRHRVLANGLKSRVSMIYFGGPPLGEKIAPLPSLMKGEESLYKEFTWFEYKRSFFNLRLADNKLVLFEKIVAS